MGITGSQLNPQELVRFKKLSPNVHLDELEIPERAENRRATNVRWICILGATIVVLLPFMIYTLIHSDISRIISGYDSCGNICGENNEYWAGIDCSGRDFTAKPYLKYENNYVGADSSTWEVLRGSCVAACPDGYVSNSGFCSQKSNKHRQTYTEILNLDGYQNTDDTDSDRSFGTYLSSIKWQFTISCSLSILVALGMLLLFRFAVSFVVWSILICCWLAMCVLASIFWYFYIFSQNSVSIDQSTSFMVSAIMCTMFAIIIGILLIWYRKRIHLVVLMLDEATKAVFRMPELMVVPVICFIAIWVLSALFIFLTVYMFSSGTLQLVAQESYQYVKNPVMIFAIAFNGFVYLWISQFFVGIQYLVIAGAVSKWYFTRDKNMLQSPVMTSAAITFKYHLGTVALGSLLIIQIQILKSIIMSLIKNGIVRAFVQSCLNSIERFFKFLSKNAYIITAMHGQSFIRSGKRAAKLIFQNICDIIALNYIGDFVLGMAVVLIMIVSVLLSIGIFKIAPSSSPHFDYLAQVAVGVVSLIAGSIAFGVFQTTVDTIYICYCEDSLLNDGMARPYFMSRNLMEFVQKSKKIFEKKSAISQ